MRHPDTVEIALWILEPDSPELSAESRGHLEGACGRCRAEAQALRSLAARAAEAIATEPRAEVYARARALAAACGGERVVEAELVEETTELQGARGEAGGAKFLVFRAEGHDLHLRVRRSGEAGLDVRGQLLPGAGGDAAGAAVRIRVGARAVARATTDRLGEFALTAASRRPFRVEVLRGLLCIRTPPISP